jgi:hypothetical protein
MRTCIHMYLCTLYIIYREVTLVNIMQISQKNGPLKKFTRVLHNNYVCGGVISLAKLKSNWSTHACTCTYLSNLLGVLVLFKHVLGRGKGKPEAVPHRVSNAREYLLQFGLLFSEET